MEAIHSKVFQAVAQIHRAEDIALHAFLEQLMAGQVELCDSSDVHVQVSPLTSLQRLAYNVDG